MKKKEKIQEILSEIEHMLTLKELYEKGHTPEEIKKFATHILDPYFQNKDVLIKLVVSNIFPEVVNVSKINQIIKNKNVLNECLKIYYKGKTEDEKSCLDACMHWYHQSEKSASKIITIRLLEHNKFQLNIEELVEECFNLIGILIEGISKPYLQCLLFQLNLSNQKRITFQKIENFDLGIIINQLLNKTKIKELFKPNPWNISLNQWRNIAYHHSFEIFNNKIRCQYRTSKGDKEFFLTPKQLLDAVQSLFHIILVFKTAYNLFTIDNRDYISKNYPVPNIEERFDSSFLRFSTALLTQGFEIKSLEIDPKISKLIIKDISNLNPYERKIHATQFLFPLWQLTNSKEMIVEYRDRNNVCHIIVKSNSEVCTKISRKEWAIEELAKRFEVIYNKY